MRADLEKCLRDEHARLRASLSQNIRSEMAKLPRHAPTADGHAPAANPLEGEALASLGRQLDAYLAGKHGEAAKIAAEAAGHYDGTRAGEMMKQLKAGSQKEISKQNAQRYLLLARLALAEKASKRQRVEVENAYANANFNDPRNPEIHREMAKYYESVGDSHAAEAYYRNLLFLTKKEPFGYIERGKLYEKLGRLKDALKDYSTALLNHRENVEAKERLEAVKAKLGGKYRRQPEPRF